MNAAGWQTLSELSPDGIVYINEQRIVEFANPAFSQMTGFPRDELINLDETVLSERIQALCDNNIEHAQCDISTIKNTEIMHWHAPANRLISCTPRQYDEGQGLTSGRVLYFHDISREKDRDQQVKSEFLAIAAHKLRTPLVGILGFSELLLKRDFDEEKQKDVIATIYRQATGFRQLLDDFLDIERLDARKGKDFRIRKTTLEQMFNDVAADAGLASNEIKLTFETSSQWPQVECDTEKIKQVLVNLVSNAVKYAPAGTEVTCKTVTRTNHGVAEFGVMVVDQGVGMSPDELARVGERFYRVDNSQPVSGSGLGIALVREIIDIHHGSFDLESTRNAGTTATFWLPVYKD